MYKLLTIHGLSVMKVAKREGASETFVRTNKTAFLHVREDSNLQ